MPNFPGIFDRLSSLLPSTVTIWLITTLISLAFLASNVTITLAQQQEQQSFDQPSTIKITTVAESTKDSFKLEVPEGWKIQDVNNTGADLISEILQGVGILAQLCPEEQQTAVSDQMDNISNSTNGTETSENTCRGAQEDVIHIVRYPNLGAKVGVTPQDIVAGEDVTANTILAYEMQKLQEAGYQNIRVVGSTDTGINVDISTGIDDNSTITATLPAKLVEMRYSTNLDPYETKTGYFLSTATSVTSHNLGTITGYGIFYEGSANPFSSSSLTPAEAAGSDENTTQSNSLVLPPEPVEKVFDTFELIAEPEAAQAIAQASADQASMNETATDETATDETATDEDAIENPLAAEIISNGTEGEAPATFVFEGDTVGGTGPYTVSWDFDDDTDEESEEEIILHTFAEAGTYNVTFTVTDSDEQSASDSIEITIDEPSGVDDEGADGAVDDEGADDDGA